MCSSFGKLLCFTADGLENGTIVVGELSVSYFTKRKKRISETQYFA